MSEDRPTLRRFVPTKRQTEIGGMALVEFHLARRGVEFTRTIPGSHRGDIWADCRGQMLSIEVKTTFDKLAWHIKRNQHGSDIYCLVHLDDARCYVVTSAEMRAAMDASPDIYPGVALVKRATLPSDTLENWMAIGLHRMPGIIREKGAPKPRRARKVKHVLATGEVKTYEYPAVPLT